MWMTLKPIRMKLKPPIKFNIAFQHPVASILVGLSTNVMKGDSIFVWANCYVLYYSDSTSLSLNSILVNFGALPPLVNWNWLLQLKSNISLDYMVKSEVFTSYIILRKMLQITNIKFFFYFKPFPNTMADIYIDYCNTTNISLLLIKFLIFSQLCCSHVSGCELDLRGFL